MSKVFIDECHAKNILQRMWEQCETEQFCDVVLIAGTEETRIPAHRSVLCASSDYFKTMFTPPFKESTAREAKVPSVDGDTLKSLVKYSYSGRIEIKEEIVEKLLISAESLLLDGVVKACGEFLAEQLHPSNCLGIAQLAEIHGCEPLSIKAKDFCMKHFVYIYETDEFLSLNAEQLSQLLASDDLRVRSEADVFKSLMAWLAYDPIEREQHKDDLLKLVRMPLMQPSFLADHVKPVCTSNASRQLYDAATEWHLIPKRRAQNAIKSTKPRRDHQFLMAITKESNKLNIWYHCPQRIEWKKWLGDLVYRESFGAAVMDDDLFIVGGRGVDGDGNCHHSNTVFCFSLKTMAVKIVNPMNECRTGVAVAGLNGFLYAVGGFNSSGFVNSVEKWDAQSNNWSTVASMSIERAWGAIAVLNEKLYMVGGTDSEPLSDVESYDPQTNAWTTVASTWEKYEHFHATVFGGMLYVVGGIGGEKIERYDPETNRWTEIGNCESIYISTSFYDKLIVLIKNGFGEYNPETNEWKVNASISGLSNVYHIFSHSGELLMSNFVEN